MRKLIVVGVALAALFLVPGARAVVLLSDSFDYTNGSLVTVSTNWFHHSPTGSNTGEVKVVEGRVFLSQTNNEDVNAPLAGGPYSGGTNVLLYARLTANFASLPAGAGTYFAHFMASSSTFRGKVFATTNGAASGAFRVGLANSDNTPSVMLNEDLLLGSSFVLVMRYAPSNAISTLWLNPAAEADVGVTATDTVTTASINAFGLRESFSSPNGMGSLYLDDLVVGTSFDDVVSSTAPPVIVTPPQDQTVTVGSNVTFRVVATGTAPSYQWQFYATNLPGATAGTLTLTNVSTNQAGPYAVTVTNAYGATSSPPATLTVTPAAVPPAITGQPQSQIVSAGDDVTFTVTADGTAPLSYQWQFYATNLPGETGATLTLAGVTTNQAGPYLVIVSNSAGSTNSQPATLTVNAAVTSSLPAFSVLTYNVRGNGTTDWSTNSTQVQAIGHQVMYLQPDIITFNEIPRTNTWQMANFVAAYLPGYYMATNSGTDGFIRSVIISRFPIIFSQKWLDGASLAPFGYTNSGFTRDLFQAQVAVPGFAQPLDVFVTHLKATTYPAQDGADKRAAEASAISNFLVTAYLPGTNSLHPYLLSGDLNEDILRPETNYTSGLPIQRLVSPPTGLQLTTPLNPITSTDLTITFPKPLNARFDYILPCGLLSSNILSSQVFRSDLLTNPPPPLLRSDDTNASDHLPVLMVFANPYDHPFRLLSIARTNQATTLNWQAVRGQAYRVEASSNLAAWAAFANNLTATGATFTLTTNVPETLKFFRVRRSP